MMVPYKSWRMLVVVGKCPSCFRLVSLIPFIYTRQLDSCWELYVWTFLEMWIVRMILKTAVKTARHHMVLVLPVREPEGDLEKFCGLGPRALCGVLSVGVVRVVVKMKLNKLYVMVMNSRPIWPFAVETDLRGPEMGLLELGIGLL